MGVVANATPDFQGVLATLLASRWRVGPAPQKKRRPRPCLAIEIPEDDEHCTTPGRELSEGLCVRNTFIEVRLPMSPSLTPFYQQRSVQTCPGTRVGLLKGLFCEGADASGTSSLAMTGTEGQTPLARLPSPAACMPPTPASMGMPPTPTADVAPAKTVALLAAMLDLGAERAMPPPQAPTTKPPPPATPAPGSAELPSIGSAMHGRRKCKPCAFLYTKGCENGAMCPFCHLCEIDERKRRRQAKQEAQKAARRKTPNQQ